MVNISKRAENTAEKVVKKYVKTVWKPSKGFFENLLTLATYASPFLGIGWLPLAATMFASHVLGINVSDLGKWLDEELGISPGQSPTEQDINKIPLILERKAQEVTASARPSISKRAGVFSFLMRNKYLVKTIFSGIRKMIVLLAGVFSVAHINELVKVMGDPIREKIENTIGDIDEVSTKVKETKDESDKSTNDMKEKMQKRLDELEKKYRGE